MTLQNSVTRLFNVAAKYPQAIQVGTINRATLTGGGPSDVTPETETPETFTARMAVFEMPHNRVDGTNILLSDLQCIVEWKSDVEITLDDTITITRGEKRIKQLGRIAPAGITLAYDMVLEG